MNKREEYQWQRSRVRISYSGGATIVSYPINHEATATEWRKEKIFSRPVSTHKDALSFAKKIATELADRAIASRNTD